MQLLEFRTTIKLSTKIIKKLLKFLEIVTNLWELLNLLPPRQFEIRNWA